MAKPKKERRYMKPRSYYFAPNFITKEEIMKRTTKTKGLLLALCAVVVMALTAGAVQATTFTWNFATGPNDVNTGVTSKIYTDTTSGLGVQITASGFNTTNSAPTDGSPWVLAGVTGHILFEKFEGFGETGLGLAGTSLGANEIQNQTLIQLDLTNIFNKLPPFTDLTIGIGSIQAPERFEIFGSDTSAANGVSSTERLVQAGGNTGGVVQSFTFSGPIPDNFIWVTANAVDVLLLNGVTAQQESGKVPEPISLILLGSGLAGAGLVRRLRKPKG